VSPSSDRQFPLCASTHFCRNILDSLGTKQIHGSTRPNTTGDSQETSTLPQRAPKYHCTMVRSRLHRRRLARTNLWICRALPHRHSSVFYVFLLNDAAISWRASRTTLIVLNAAEAELYSLSSATQEAIYLRKVCIELGFLQNSPTIMHENYQAAVALSKENRCRNGSKHISFRWSFGVERQSLAFGDIAVVGISAQVCLQTYSARLDPHRALYHSATQYWDTHRCPSHRYQMRRGTPLTRSWFMPALNTQRFTIVLTHPSSCFSHAEYHCVWLSINLMCNLSSKVFARKIWYLLGLLFFPPSQTSIDML